ncbi:MAG: c-type cytochrome [Planctomycetes bacterium]|nr:c-type cytochrome [Planctomycetota bacterium]MCB9887423.1 c-type cytochrome [Planctomycetota bacterium]
MRSPVCLIACALLALPLAAQRGDRPGEAQTLLPADVVVPPATVRSPAEELATFKIQPGYEVQLVASEPLLGDPVAATFDAAGDLWVVEMRAYMRDVDAIDEHEPIGRISVLHDDDGDGRMDRARVFLDGLVLPRAVLPLRGGALVIEPPQLLWCPDADGDGVADSKQPIMGGFEAGLENPEHSGNGLDWGLDHRIHLADDRRVLRWTPTGFAVETGSGGGQWGISHDDRGRFYFNYNEDWLRCDLVPGVAAARLGAGALPGLNHRLVADRTVWPIRITPGVNRGYQPGRLVDYVLAIHTAVCATHVYRDDLLPCQGDVFVCEPAGNCVRRIVLEEPDGLMRGANPYQAQRQEFLASTDERFRPVNLFGGPDRALYLIDMYRGVIQHRNYVTTYLRDQIHKRGLERPTGLGRIWRIVPSGAAAGGVAAEPAIAVATAEQLVAALESPSSWRRDQALRELVQRRAQASSGAIRSRLRGHERAAIRIVMLSALAGLGRLDRDDLRLALRDEDPGVVCFALQHCAAPLAAGDGVLWSLVAARAAQGPPSVAWHAAIACGEVLQARADARQHARAQSLLAALLSHPDADKTALELAAAAAGAHAVPVLARCAEDRLSADAARALARVVARRRQAAEVGALLDFARGAATERAGWVLRGLLEGLPKGAARRGSLTMPATPAALSSLVQSPAADVASRAGEVLAAIAIVPVAGAAKIVARSPEEQRRLAKGERLFATTCAACHQLDGNGMAGLAPPLRDSEWVAGPVDRLIRIALHGVKGPIEANGQAWDGEMPGQGHLPDGDLADILDYVRAAFARDAAGVAAGDVEALRKAHAKRGEPWTAEELLR